MDKKEACKIFGILWDEYVDCPIDELDEGAKELRKNIMELVGDYDDKCCICYGDLYPTEIMFKSKYYCSEKCLNKDVFNADKGV